MKVRSQASLETGEILQKRAMIVIASSTLRWKKRTRYERQRYLALRYFDDYNLGVQDNIYHLISKNDKYYCNIPSYIGLSLMGAEIVTFVIGPFVFTNGFEKTEEGQFVIRITPYYIMNTMTKEASDKLLDVFNKYSGWIHEDETFKHTQEIIANTIKEEKEGKFRIAFEKDVQYGQLQEQCDKLQKACNEVKWNYVKLEKDYVRLRKMLKLD